MKITTVEEADKITMDWIAKNIDIEAARLAYMPQPPSSQGIRHRFAMPTPGTWMVDPYGGIEVLVEIPICQFQPSEGDWDFALRYPETQDYIQWQKEGHEPPPLSVIRTASGNLRSCNRRRWLAAREAGIKMLKCWYSPTHPEHCASPKWDVKYL